MGKVKSILINTLFGIYILLALFYFIMTTPSYSYSVSTFKLAPINFAFRAVEVALFPISITANYLLDNKNNILRTGIIYPYQDYVIQVDNFEHKKRIFVYKENTPHPYVIALDGDCRKANYHKCDVKRKVLLKYINKLIKHKGMKPVAKTYFDGLYIKKFKR